MSAPAVTIYPEATIPHAAQIMTSHHIRRLPVVGEDGRLIGIVTRRDLLSVFLRPDDEIAEHVRALLDDVLPADPGQRHGHRPRWRRHPHRPPRSAGGPGAHPRGDPADLGRGRGDRRLQPAR